MKFIAVSSMDKNSYPTKLASVFYRRELWRWQLNLGVGIGFLLAVFAAISCGGESSSNDSEAAKEDALDPASAPAPAPEPVSPSPAIPSPAPPAQGPGPAVSSPSPGVGPSPFPGMPALDDVTLAFAEAPPALTNKKVHVFKIDVKGKADRFECSIDSTRIPCAEDVLHRVTIETAELLDGNHTFAIEAFSGTTKVGSSTHAFKIDSAPPVLSFSSTVPATLDNTVVGSAGTRGFSFTISRGTDTFAEIFTQLNSGAWTKLESGNVVSVTVEPGSHTLRAKGLDQAGNESVAIEKTWTVLAKYYAQTVAGDVVLRERGDSPSIYWFTEVFSQVDWATADSGCDNLFYAGFSNWTLPSAEIARNWAQGGVRKAFPSATQKFWTSTTSMSGWKYTNDFAGESSWPTVQTAYVRCIRLPI